MRILVTGNGSAGSWQIRGQQLGYALGATVRPRATLAQLKKADIAVVVKRIPPSLRKALSESKTPWVWDLVDFYPQPACTAWGQSKAFRWVREQIRELKPTAVIWPTAGMRADCDTGLPNLVLYHHHWPEMAVNPVRKKLHKVGYEGNGRYLGSWQKVIEKACKARGLEFVVNTGTHADWDVCVAFRDASVNGYCQRHWKSNVKLANAHGSGTPFIGPSELGYIETSVGGEIFIDDDKDFGSALDSLADYKTRLSIHERFRAGAITLDTVAAKYRYFLETL